MAVRRAFTYSQVVMPFPFPRLDMFLHNTAVTIRPLVCRRPKTVDGKCQYEDKIELVEKLHGIKNDKE